MERKKVKSISPVWYIVYFLVGTIIFLVVSCRVNIPVYETMEGLVEASGEEIILKIADCDIENMPEQIYYYINREEWVEQATEYDAEKAGYRIENLHKLENHTVVYIDVEKEQMTLFEIIFLKGGNV